MTGVHSRAPGPGEYPDELEIEPLSAPVDALVRVPGSKSITNRALVCAGLATGESDLHGVLFADDTEAMLGGLHELGVGLTVDRAGSRVDVRGVAGTPPTAGAVLDARLSGTTSRFLLPVAALGHATVVVDGDDPLRLRPMGDLLDALAGLGAAVDPLGSPGHLPVRLGADGLSGGQVVLRGDVSSQFLSGLLLAAPCMVDGLRVGLEGPLVSVPYVRMTLTVMAEFGARWRWDDDVISVEPGGYRSVDRYVIEPDASAATYFFAAAAITEGRVRVDGLGPDSLQGDVAFVDVLEAMGAHVERGTDYIQVTGTGELRGVDVDLGDISDTAQTLAVVAPYADSPTTIRGIGFIRGKETDRIAAVVAELRACGIHADELADGMRIHPGEPRPATVHTYHDHRMAMSFAVLGLRAPGVTIADPGCVAKTFPTFWQVLETLRWSSRS